MSEASSVLDQLKNTVKDNTANAGNSIGNFKESFKSGLDDFSKKGPAGVGSDFMESNGLLAKFAFIIFVLIIFLFLFKVGVQALGYFMGPNKSPFIVYGKLDGTNAVTIPQDPGNTSSVQVLRSNNQPNGAEFTWSAWLYLNQAADDEHKCKAIFYKGPVYGANSFSKSTAPKGNYDINGNKTGVSPTNGPGMYVSCGADGVAHLLFYQDDIDNKNQPPIIVDNVPLQKWVHVAYRLENTLLDVYINGNINNRFKMSYAPKINYYDIQICPNGGFSGFLSNLRYYDYALSVFDINNIVMFGPNTANSKLSSDYQNANGDYSYLSTKWYNLK
jgi:hypothetical protein